MSYHHNSRMRRINEDDVPESKHTIFIRGLPGSMSTDEIKDFFEDKIGPVSFDFVRSSPDNVRLFVAVRFETREDAKSAMNRYSDDDILGHKCELTWFKDIRRFAQYQSMYGRSRGKTSGHNRNRSYRTDRNEWHRDKSRSPRRSSSRDSSRKSSRSRRSRSRSRSSRRSSSIESYHRSNRDSSIEKNKENKKSYKRCSRSASSSESPKRQISSPKTPSIPPNFSGTSRTPPFSRDGSASPSTTTTLTQSSPSLPKKFILKNKSDLDNTDRKLSYQADDDEPLKSLPKTPENNIQDSQTPELDRDTSSIELDSLREDACSPRASESTGLHPFRKVLIRSDSFEDIPKLPINETVREPSTKIIIQQTRVPNTSMIPIQLRSTSKLENSRTTSHNSSSFNNLPSTSSIQNGNHFSDSNSRAQTPTTPAHSDSSSNQAVAERENMWKPIQNQSNNRNLVKSSSKYFGELKEVQSKCLQTVKIMPKKCVYGSLRLSNLAMQSEQEGDESEKLRVRDEKISSLSELDFERFLIQKKKMERAFQSDCEAFAFVTKKLIEKDNTLEKPLRMALIENLEELEKQFMEKIDAFLF